MNLSIYNSWPVRFALLVLLTVVLLRCSESERIETHTLGVYVQGTFDNDSVMVAVDDEILINQRLSTLNVLGVCYVGEEVLTTKVLREGDHTLAVSVNGEVSTTYDLSLRRDAYVSINFDPETKQISFSVSDSPTFYD
jgi:hypothetical protein